MFLLAQWEILLQSLSFLALVIGILIFVLTLVGLGLDIGFDFDIDANPDTDLLGLGAPLLLLVGTYTLGMGLFGVVLYSIEMDSIFRAIIVIGVPILMVVAVAMVWKRIAKSDLLDIPINEIQINDEVTCLTDVDENGGLVRVERRTTAGPIKMAAKTYGGIIKSGTRAYIIEKLGNTVIIDKWPVATNKAQILTNNKNNK